MLDYGKTHELQSILATQRDMIRNLFGTKRYPAGLNYYRQKYDDFRRLEWLKLPRNLFPPPATP